jgi:transcription termination factor Rho
MSLNVYTSRWTGRRRHLTVTANEARIKNEERPPASLKSGTHPPNRYPIPGRDTLALPTRRKPLESVSGYLEILDKGFGFLRTLDKNFMPHATDPFVPAHLIRKCNLAEGVLIEGAGGKTNAKSTNIKLAQIETVNGMVLDTYSKIKPLHQQTSINPSEQYILCHSPDDIIGRALDMIVPIGKGQRGLVVSPPKSGKTTILKHIAESIQRHHPEVELFILLVDERPEEVTDFKRGLSHACVLASSADQSVAQHLRMTRLAMNTATRSAEIGRDVVVLIDSLTRMSRAFNNQTQSHGRTLSGGLAADALTMPRRVFGAARNIEQGGSLTVVATILVDTGSRMDDVIFQEFKGTGNMDLVLSRKCAEQRLWPAIDINASGTRKEHLLMKKNALQEAIHFRRQVATLDEVSALMALHEYLDSSE